MHFPIITLLAPLSAVAASFSAPRHGSVRRHSAVNNALAKRGGFNNVEGTHYDVTTGTSACGDNPSPSDFVVAMGPDLFPGSCHKKITINYQGRTAVATCVDECMGCWNGHIDMSDGLMNYLSPGGDDIQLSWFWGTSAPAPPPPPPPPPPPKTTTQKPKPTPTTTHTTSTTHTKASSQISSSASSAAVSASASAGVQDTGNIQALMHAMVQMGDVVVSGASITD